MSPLPLFIYGEAYNRYDFGKRHPLQSLRLRVPASLIKAYGLLEEKVGFQLAPVPASEQELELFHTPRYIERVKRLSNPATTQVADYEIGLGPGDNPIFPGMHLTAAHVVGGTLAGMTAVMEGRATAAFNLAGGLHHALPEKASGFCLYNDAVIGILQAKRRYGARVLYVDVDAHHGDGVQNAFYDDPEVLVVSLHETGERLFPGTGFFSEQGEGAGFGYTVNLPLPPKTADADYLYLFESVVPALAEAFKPDLLVTQNGCDSHRDDPLSHLSLTTEAFTTLARSFHELAYRHSIGRWLALSGGGYNSFFVNSRAWSLLFAQMCGVRLPPYTPKEWRQEWQELSEEPLPKRTTNRRNTKNGAVSDFAKELAEKVQRESPLLKDST